MSSTKIDHGGVNRSLKILRLMKGGGMTISDLAEKIKISPRTVYRYIESFADSGIQVIKKVEASGVYYSIIKADDLNDDLEMFSGLDAFEKKDLHVKGENVVLLKCIYSVEVKKTGKVSFFTDVKAIANDMKINRNVIYNFFRNEKTIYENNVYIIKKGVLYRSKESIYKYKKSRQPDI
jgi:DNA-binding transcriptional ArsR family regulator